METAILIATETDRQTDRQIGHVLNLVSGQVILKNIFQNELLLRLCGVLTTDRQILIAYSMQKQHGTADREGEVSFI